MRRTTTTWWIYPGTVGARVAGRSSAREFHRLTGRGDRERYREAAGIPLRELVGRRVGGPCVWTEVTGGGVPWALHLRHTSSPTGGAGCRQRYGRGHPRAGWRAPVPVNGDVLRPHGVLPCRSTAAFSVLAVGHARGRRAVGAGGCLAVRVGGSGLCGGKLCRDGRGRDGRRRGRG